MKKFLTIFLQILAILPAFIDANLCGLASCGNKTHIDCKLVNGVIPIPSTCKNAVMLDLTVDRTAIVKKHNTLRNHTAGGAYNMRATRMGTMRWDTDLAAMARKNVRKCTFTHDDCRNTANFKYVGQNIARAVYPKTDKRTNVAIMLQLMDKWYAEVNVVDRYQIDYYPDINYEIEGTPVSHDAHIRNYCQLVHELTTRVGCGAMRYEENANYVMLFTCLYDSRNKLNWPVYDVTDIGKAASKCKKGVNANFRNLCAFNETFQVNNYQIYYGPPYPI